MFGNKKSKTINVKKFMAGLMDTGLRADDPRLKEMYENVSTVRSSINNSSFDDNPLVVDYDTFFGIISDNLEVVVRAFSHSFVIPQFKNFCAEVNKIYEKCKKNTCGEVASYIPQLFRVKKDHWAVSIVTVDGQRYSMGDVKKPFTIQSCSKPLSYAIACADNGPETMHKYMGMEPSGRYFNDLSLDYNNKPHNPMINSGAIMTASLIKPDYSAADRFEYIFEMYKRLAGDEYLGFNNSVYLSEKSCADRNFALAYFMRENDCFPPGTKMQDVLDFYFQLCSMEITAESGAVIAATLANGGINPLNGDPVLTCEAVRNTLTLMHSCGMYNYSGEFAFKVGLPAKSGVSGCILLVVPNTLGICLWSPALDENGNSCRGTQFCDELVETFKFHHFDNLRGNLNDKIDPRMNKTESNAQVLFDLLFSVAACDFSSLRRHALAGTNLELADYDGRTALHVAASEGHLELVEFLLEKCQINPAPKDRWLRTPLDDSRDFGHPDVEKLIAQSYALRGIPVPPPVESPRFQPPKQEPYWIPRCVTEDKKKKDSSS